MDKKTPPVTPPFNEAANPKDHDDGNDHDDSGGGDPQKPKPEPTLDMKGPIGNAVRALHFDKSNKALSNSSGNGRGGDGTLGKPRGSNSGNPPDDPRGLKETFNPAARGDNGHDHSR